VTASAPEPATARWHVRADAERSYEIRAIEALLDPGRDAMLQGGRVPGRRFVILDSAISPRWQERFRVYFERHGVDTQFLVIPGGEGSKNIDVATDIIAELQRYGVERRHEPVIVVGGGAVLDTASFAASVYRRGVPFIRVPTTLLSYVDASVGIKTGINFGRAKNLVGTFTVPHLVLLTREFFGTLPVREIANGLGEVLKLGLGCDTALFCLLESGAATFAATRLCDAAGFEILWRSIDVMLAHLRSNIYETELARAVDLGHTFSQAFEMAEGTGGIRHGEAVSFDLNLSAIISARRGLLGAAELRRLAGLTISLGLPTAVPELDPSAVWDSLAERTRHRAGRQRVPLPRYIGECVFVNDLTAREVFDAFDELRYKHFGG
jgi:3-dehydroquinate synthetase